MAKEKKAKSSITNKNIHLRLSFLHRAASYLAECGYQDVQGSNTPVGVESQFSEKMKPQSAHAKHLVNHMKGVSRKAVIRLQSEVKRTVCKGCDELLVDGRTSTRIIENRSKDKKKLRADVLVVKCSTCGMMKRFPADADMLEDKKQNPNKGKQDDTGVSIIAQDSRS